MQHPGRILRYPVGPPLDSCTCTVIVYASTVLLRISGLSGTGFDDPHEGDYFRVLV